MEGIAQQINLEEALILNTVKHRYEAAGKRLAEIEERLTRQTDLSMALNEKASQYQILERDVETHQQIYNSLLERSREIESMAGVAPTNVQIVAPATPPVFPSRPNLTLNLALALLFGLTGGIGLAFLKEYLSRRIHHPTEIAHRFQIPILGLIPAARPGRQNLDTAIRDTPSSPFTEAMLAVRVSLGAATAFHRQTSLLITSSLPGEGKTTLTANMALAFAGAGEKTLLIDADLRKPRLQHVFGKRTSMGRPGLADYLRGAGSEGLIQSNGRANLHFIAAGAIPPNPSALLTSHRMRSLLKTLGPKYDLILIDSPPLLGFADVMVLSQYVDGVVLVSWPEATTRDELRLFKQTMAGVNARVTGCIINKVNLAGRLGRYPNPYGENAYHRGTS
jgi:capsular exopolysaccharide synthesis family protein